MVALRKYLPVAASGLVGVFVGAVLLGGFAYAANGGYFLLGRANSATITTTLTNSAGTPLSLAARSGYPPLKVNSAVKVPYLNADRLDGLDSLAFVRAGTTVANATNALNLAGRAESSFALATAKTGSVESVGSPAPVDVNGDTVPDYYTTTATCPAGTVLTGGGFIGDSSLIIGSFPLSPSTWMIGSYQTNFYAIAVCVGLRGTLPAGVTPFGNAGSSPAGLLRSSKS